MSNAPNERPILFSGPMVQAILSGAKTQTRRIMSSHPGPSWSHDGFGRITSKHAQQGRFGLFVRRGIGSDFPECDIVPSPYGQPGDRLWVREKWARHDEDGLLIYGADIGKGGDADDWYRNRMEGATGYRWKPSIHMPRSASRITLEITGVRVERLQEISEADCIAEGCAGRHGSIPGYGYAATPSEHYHWLWNSINGPNSWETNPWVWAIDFKSIERSPA